MEEHLSTRDLEGYRQGSLPPLGLLAADDHLTACAPCQARLAEAVPAVAAWQTLRAALPVSAEAETHLSYEQLAAYVDGQLGETARRAAAHHLEACEMCAAEWQDLRAFSVALTPTPQSKPAATVAASSLAAPASLFQQIKELFTLRRPMLAGVSALLLLASWLLFTQLRRQTAPPEIVTTSPTVTPAPVNVEASPAVPVSVLALNDAGGQVSLDAQGNLHFPQPLPAAYEQMVKRALLAGRVETPALAGLNVKTGALMGGNAGVPFALLAPVAQVSETARPKFRWQVLEGATSYTVTIYNAAFNKVATSPPLTNTEWQPDQPLPRGVTYSWQVKAFKDGQEVAVPMPPAPEAKFKVLEQAKWEEVRQARRQFAGSHLALGLVYAQAGLLTEAEREFQTLADANRTTPLARKLLQSVKAAAR